MKKDTEGPRERIFDVIDLSYIDFIFGISNNAVRVNLRP